MAGAAATFNALPTQMAMLADALRAKVEAGAAGAAATPDTPDTPDTQTQTQD
jgi:large subunit ribosomal protein L10